MSSFIGAGLTCGFNLDLIKTTPPTIGGCHSSSSSSISSTLSKCSDSSSSSFSISTKRARTPRKRPNQSYNEAAALLSTIYPNLFTPKNLHKKYSKQLSPVSSSNSSSTIIPPLPVVNESDFLFENQSTSPKSPPRFKFKHASASASASASDSNIEKACVGVQEGFPSRSPDYNVESILDEEVEEGIDSIMGKLSMGDCDYNNSLDADSYINPCVGSLMGFGFGLGGRSVREALRGVKNEDEDGGMPQMMVPMEDIVPRLNALLPLEKKKTMMNKKSKKKMEKEVIDEAEIMKPTGFSRATRKIKLEGGLGLKLNHTKVLRAWSGHGFPFLSESGVLESTTDIAARLAKIDLSVDTESEGATKVSPRKQKGKRMTSSKKILCQVRKVNADCQPRVKGRFVKKASPP